MNPNEILLKYYQPHSLAFSILYQHSNAVADLAILIAENSRISDLDLQFIKEASLLHDIGVFLCYAPDIGCFGKNNYMQHGVLGRELLEQEGLVKHALVCERHIGVGLSVDDIVHQKLPLPLRDMQPVSNEEIIITIADLFSSKLHPDSYKNMYKVESNVKQYGSQKLDIFLKWKKKFRLDALELFHA